MQPAGLHAGQTLLEMFGIVTIPKRFIVLFQFYFSYKHRLRVFTCTRRVNCLSVSFLTDFLQTPASLYARLRLRHLGISLLRPSLASGECESRICST